MKNLRVLDLTSCVDLLVTPKFSGCKNLAILILERCSQLVEVDHSIGDLKCLISLNLKFCTELSMLPVEMGHLTALKELLMDGTKVEEIPISIGQFKQLEGPIATLPDSVGELIRLNHLSVRDCHRIRKLPNSIGNIGISLVELDVSGTGVSKFPNSIKYLQKLKVLRMDSCFFKEFPPDIGELTSLEEIHASWCRSLEGGIPSEIGKLHNLRILRLRHSTISSIPMEIHQLSNLQTLDLLHCDMIKELPRLPSSIRELHVDDELKSSEIWILDNLRLQRLSTSKLPAMIKLSNLQTRRLLHCNTIKEVPKLPSGMMDLRVGDELKSSKIWNLHDLRLELLSTFIIQEEIQLSDPDLVDYFAAP
ncbi:TMV resistance protein N-like [Eucalyptus grandis]|uniref:TMV resistance protein N-like n=1 Tax=Eucalyptus grandis TaxID=71139 RepID=UPI00192E962F|nr:TMV resistance protein N-like [Eucalyptus grandis]